MTREADELFLESLADLEHRLRPDRETYDLLAAAAILRKLAVDGSRLIDIVNRDYRVRLRFTYRSGIPPIAGEQRLLYWLAGEGLDPETVVTEAGAVVTASIAKFMAEPIGFAAEGRVTVRDLIKYMANVLGGVHLGPLDKSHVHVATLHGAIGDADEHGSAIGAYLQIESIARVFIRGAQPLRSAVQERRARLRRMRAVKHS